MNKEFIQSLAILYNSTKEESIRKFFISEKFFSEEEWSCIDENKIDIGMSEYSVLAAIGDPIKSEVEYVIDENTWMSIKIAHDIYENNNESLIHVYYKNDVVFLITDELKDAKEFKKNIPFLKEN